VDDRQLRRDFRRHWQQPGRIPDFDHDLLRALGEQLRQFDLSDDNSNSECSADSSDIRFGESVRDLFGSEQHADGDRWFRHNLRLVHRKLRRSRCWNRHVDSRYPRRDDDLLRPLGERLRQFQLPIDHGDGRRASGYSYYLRGGGGSPKLHRQHGDHNKSGRWDI